MKTLNMYKQIKKSTNNSLTPNKNESAIQKKKKNRKGHGLVDNRRETNAVQTIQSKAVKHEGSCGCASCSGVKQLKSKQPKPANDKVAQLAACKHCKFEKGHAKGCTPESRAAANKSKKDEVAKQHDKSMDNRTRADQSHTQHGGDAKGRQKMYDRRGK